MSYEKRYVYHYCAERDDVRVDGIIELYRPVKDFDGYADVKTHINDEFKLADNGNKISVVSFSLVHIVDCLEEL